MTLLEFFDHYVENLGWRVIPVFPSSKVPVGRRWNSKYDKKWSRHYISGHADCNLGLLLGDVVDVEGDTPEANEVLKRIIGDEKHPMFRSDKSIHHLFLSPDPTLTAIRHRGIEFRGKKHFSVLPPSRHAGGVTYEWISEPDNAIPPMPESLLCFYQAHKCRARQAQSLISANCTSCGIPVSLPSARFDLEIEAFRKNDIGWQCRNCRSIDVRGICRFLRQQKIRAS